VDGVQLAVASSNRHFEQILDLQRRNSIGSLSREAQDLEGFVYVQHTVPLLERMAAKLPQAIALADDRVVGYCLALSPSLQSDIPSLAPMFEHFARCAYRGRPLASHRLFVGGQVCVDRAYRGRGLLARLYRQIRDSLSAAQDLCVTEIAVRNGVSIRSHERMGFEIISRYADPAEEWVIAAWDLK
jgi:GNAT superfamily N-acetyltransferase